MAKSSNTPEPPKIVFPCDYPIRVMGAAAPDFKDFVIRVVKKHALDFDGKAQVKDSRTGKYLSVHVVIRATGVGQLQALHAELKASGRVQMVL
ncbi:DUF493 domain-containing protein [Candidatus Sororendozoicomonas aggregata]|uniref:YbeD family protein n=1 Tax=Candidatus Sororendozoicomonas aggregata TaxID=3073239 RepID=UPI002ED1C010